MSYYLKKIGFLTTLLCGWLDCNSQCLINLEKILGNNISRIKFNDVGVFDENTIQFNGNNAAFAFNYCKNNLIVPEAHFSYFMKNKTPVKIEYSLKEMGEYSFKVVDYNCFDSISEYKKFHKNLLSEITRIEYKKNCDLGVNFFLNPPLQENEKDEETEKVNYRIKKDRIIVSRVYSYLLNKNLVIKSVVTFSYRCSDSLISYITSEKIDFKNNVRIIDTINFHYQFVGKKVFYNNILCKELKKGLKTDTVINFQKMNYLFEPKKVSDTLIEFYTTIKGQICTSVEHFMEPVREICSDAVHLEFEKNPSAINYIHIHKKNRPVKEYNSYFALRVEYHNDSLQNTNCKFDFLEDIMHIDKNIVQKIKYDAPNKFLSHGFLYTNLAFTKESIGKQSYQLSNYDSSLIDRLISNQKSLTIFDEKSNHTNFNSYIKLKLFYE